MALSDLACRHAQAQIKLYRLPDGDNLFLEVTPKGKKYWRYRYSIFGNEKTLALGQYPLIGLLKARQRRDKAREQLDAGIDPIVAKNEAKLFEKYESSQTFELLTRDWHAHYHDTWKQRTADIILRRFELYMFPYIGKYPVSKITAQLMVSCLQRVELNSPDVAERLFKHSHKVFRYGRLTGRPNSNPTLDLADTLKKYKKGNYASIELEELPDLLHAINTNTKRLYRRTILAIKLLMLTAVRTCEMIHAKWPEVHFDQARWIVPAERMKMGLVHVVPLSKQAIAILRELKGLAGNSEYIFPGVHNQKKPMSNCTIIRALERMQYKGKMTGHGFRTLFMGVCKEKLKATHDVVDRQLAHVPKGLNGKAYDRAKFLSERTELMQKFADYIDQITQSKPKRKINDDHATTYPVQQFINYNPSPIIGGIGYKITGLGQHPNSLYEGKKGVIPEAEQRPGIAPQLLEDDGRTTVH